MPYTVQQLFDDRESVIPPIGIERNASVQDALNLMLKKQYSQLPVVDKENRLIGEHTTYMVTNESILRALSNLNVVAKNLKVSDAMVKIRPYRLDDELSDLLKDLTDTYAVPIIGDKRQLVGVVTSYDTTEYFRKRAQDMMDIERIEKKLKEYILVYFTTETGETDYNALNMAITDSTPSNKKELRGPFQQALQSYLELLDGKQAVIQNKLAEQVFNKHLYRKDDAKPFDRLTFDEYITLFVHEERWKRYMRIFSLDSKSMQNFLIGIRDIRNALAHFRIETITEEQRDKIQFCEGWLESFHNAVMEEFQPHPSVQPPDAMEPINLPPLINKSLEENDAIEVLQLAEEKPSDSRYAPLAAWLQEQLPSEQAVQLTFQQIEAIIGDTLPPSAHERFWWANNSTTRVQSQQWLEVGWRVSKMDMSEETVVFSRIKDREKLYIDFFSELLSMLKISAPFPIRQSSPDGFNWIIITRIPKGASQTAFLGVSFARRGRFRVELYIDTGNKTLNKALFDALYQRKSIILNELTPMLGSLEWERIDDKRASRIAIYRSGAIGERAEKLAELRTWATDAAIRLFNSMERHVSEVIHDL